MPKKKMRGVSLSKKQVQKMLRASGAREDPVPCMVQMNMLLGCWAAHGKKEVRNACIKEQGDLTMCLKKGQHHKNLKWIKQDYTKALVISMMSMASQAGSL